MVNSQKKCLSDCIDHEIAGVSPPVNDLENETAAHECQVCDYENHFYLFIICVLIVDSNMNKN